MDKVKDIAKNYEVTTGQNKNLKQKPNVVVIMNETFSDLNVVNKIKTNKEVMPYINSMKENTIKVICWYLYSEAEQATPSMSSSQETQYLLFR